MFEKKKKKKTYLLEIRWVEIWIVARGHWASRQIEILSWIWLSKLPVSVVFDVVQLGEKKKKWWFSLLISSSVKPHMLLNRDLWMDFVFKKIYPQNSANEQFFIFFIVFFFENSQTTNLGICEERGSPPRAADIARQLSLGCHCWGLWVHSVFLACGGNHPPGAGLLFFQWP